MKKIKSKLIFKKLVYIVTLFIAIIGLMFVATKTNNVMDNSKKIAEKSDSNTNIVQVAKNEENTTSITTTSRSSDEVRNSKDDEKVSEENTTTVESTTNQENTTTVESTKNENEKNEENKTTNNTTKSSENTTSSVSIKDIKISKDMDLTVRTGLSKEDFIKLMAGVKADTSGFFEENAGTIYDLCEKYSINEIFFCGLISAESGWNIAANHRRTHNYISLMSKNGLIHYNSVNEGLEVAAKKLHNNYLTKSGCYYHGKTLAGVKKCFCPASSTWVDLVYGRMKQILK